MSNFTHEDYLTFSTKTRSFRQSAPQEKKEPLFSFLDEFEPELKLLSSFKLSPHPATLRRIQEELYKES